MCCYKFVLQQKWNKISGDIDLIISCNFIEKNYKNINWDILCSRNDLFDYINIFIVKKYFNYFNWKIISLRTGGKLPRCVIDLAYKKLNWNYISSSVDLDEDTITTYNKYVNWDEIFMYQDLSLEYMIKWKHMISDKCLLYYII